MITSNITFIVATLNSKGEEVASVQRSAFNRAQVKFNKACDYAKRARGATVTMTEINTLTGRTAVIATGSRNAETKKFDVVADSAKFISAPKRSANYY